MSLEEWALIASVVFTGLFSGLYAMLNLIFHPVMGALDGPEFARFLRRFLTVARRSPFNYVVVIGMVVAPAVALIASDDAGNTPFVLTAIGLVLTLGGNAAVSNRIAEPSYDRMLAGRSAAALASSGRLHQVVGRKNPTELRCRLPRTQRSEEDVHRRGYIVSTNCQRHQLVYVSLPAG